MSLNGSWIEVNVNRLRNNLQTFRGLLDSETKLLTVVKANAYGHGLEPTSQAIAGHTDWFGVDSIAEATILENNVPDKPILILGAFSPDHVSPLVERGYRQTLYRMDVAQALSGEAKRQGRLARVHLKVETGTNRQGVPVDEAADFARAVADLPCIEVEGISTHFANIEDTLDPAFAQGQLVRFRQALRRVHDAGLKPREIHTAATAGILLYPETHFTMVRLGIGAYGVWPSRETQIAVRARGRRVQLQPALRWKTRIVQVKRIDAGEYVGYGLTYQAPRPMTLAVIPTGYYEGYDRRLSSNGCALVGGRRVAVVGRVAMNMTVLDVTEVDDVRLDQEVVLIGKQEGVEITAAELADKIGTIPYEVLSRINPLLERRCVFEG